MSAIVLNADRLVSKLSQLPDNIRNGIGAALLQSVVELDAAAKRSIQGGSRTGRVYRRGKCLTGHRRRVSFQNGYGPVGGIAVFSIGGG
jgi:hypothetical protein